MPPSRPHPAAPGDGDGSGHEAPQRIHMPLLVPSVGYITLLKHAGLLFFLLPKVLRVAVLCVLPAVPVFLPDPHELLGSFRPPLPSPTSNTKLSCSLHPLHPPAHPPRCILLRSRGGRTFQTLPA